MTFTPDCRDCLKIVGKMNLPSEKPQVPKKALRNVFIPQSILVT